MIIIYVVYAYQITFKTLNILNLIVYQVFFEEQLKKHDGTCALIQANLDAQPKILKWAPHVL